MLRVTITALALCLTMGCEEPLTEGTVTEKQYEPAHTFVALLPVTMGNSTIMIPYTHYDDEDFILVVEGERDGKVIRQRLYVSGHIWNRLEVGEMYRQASSGADLFDPIHRERN